jgi:hypothetical protein
VLAQRIDRLANTLAEAHATYQAKLMADEALLRQALDALDLSRPAQCGQSDELWAQERADHRAAIAALKERLK